MKIDSFNIFDREEVFKLLSEVEIITGDLTIDKLKDFLVSRLEDVSVDVAIGIESYQNIGFAKRIWSLI